MAKIESWLHCDLKKAVQVQELKGNVFSLDNNGSRIRVRIFDNGEKATVSGTVTAKCILADDSTVNVNGSLATVDGQSVASVDIPQGCLLVPGTIRIAIKLTDSSVITTLAAVISTVYRTSTDNVITPSAQIIADWNQEISDALAAQDAQIEVQDGKIDDLKSALNDTAFISGNGNTYIEQDFALVKAGKSYKAQICSWDTSGVTVTGGYTKFYLGYKNNGTKVKIAEILMSGTIESEYNVQIPANAVNPVLVIGGRVTASKQGVVRVEDISLNAEINKNSNRIGKIDLISQFEVGGMSISNSGWSYSLSANRVRTRQGISFHLFPGDKVGLTNYTDARFCAGFKKTDGTYDSYSWRTSDLTITYEGYYVFLISNITETIQTDETALASLFFGYEGVAFDKITENNNKLADLSTVYSDLTVGYLNANGGISNDGNVTNKAVTTDYIPACKNDYFDLSFSFEESKSMWLAYCLYDTEKHMIGSRNVVINSESYINGNYRISITDQNAKYIRISYRTFDTIIMTITTQNMTKINTTGVHNNEKSINELNRRLTANAGMVKSIAHRGSNIAPENTMAGFRHAVANGFNNIETDVAFTSDGVAVLLHDSTINRTARNADGTQISETVNIYDITYEEALEYDFGIWKGEQYAGEKIPTLDEFLLFCRNTGVNPYIELKYNSNYEFSKITHIPDRFKKYGLYEKASVISFTQGYLNEIANNYTGLRIGVLGTTMSNDLLNYAVGLQNSGNSIFVDVSEISDEMVTACISANVPAEMWTAASESAILALNPYFTGIAADDLSPSKILFNNAMGR